MPDGLAAARALGLRLEEAGGYAFRGIRFINGGASGHASFPNGAGRGMRRTDLHNLMVEHALDAGVHLAWGTRIGGISEQGVRADDRMVRARWIVGADGSNSLVRRWAGLDECERDSRRFGFRRHYRVAPWSEYMELHWGDGRQIYCTPVATDEVCVVVISRDRRLRLDQALARFPEVQRRLSDATPLDHERGAVTASRRLKRVWRGNVALVGDASGSVDAITGEGLCLLFQQSAALAEALVRGDLAAYQDEHRKIGRHPQLMADMMLLMDQRRRLRSRAMRAFASKPALFEHMLAMHTGSFSPALAISSGLALGWRMLTV
jgi:flavin-dependent dehydrogenase